MKVDPKSLQRFLNRLSIGNLFIDKLCYYICNSTRHASQTRCITVRTSSGPSRVILPQSLRWLSATREGTLPPLVDRIARPTPAVLVGVSVFVQDNRQNMSTILYKYAIGMRNCTANLHSKTRPKCIVVMLQNGDFLYMRRVSCYIFAYFNT